jgi:hypothetical protein
MAQIIVEPIIANTTMTKYVNSSGRELAYFITPNEGYVIHDNTLDFPDSGSDEPTNLGFTTTQISVHISYDFEVNERELYTVLATEVPENQIFGVTNNAETI